MLYPGLQKRISDYIGAGGHPADVYEMLAEAMAETESHLETNWEDRAMASVWRKLAAKARNAADHARKALRPLGYK